MKGVILAAGKGERLHPLTESLPKCLLNINGESLIEYQIAALRWLNVTDIVVVVGYLADKIKERLGADIKYVYNPDYARTGSLGSLWHAREELKGDFIYLHADVLFDRQILKELLKAQGDICLTVDKKRCVKEDMKVKVNSNRITEINKMMNISEAYGEFIGLIKFSKQGTSTLLEVLNGCIAEGSAMDYFEVAIQRLIDKGHKVDKLDVNPRLWVEVDFYEDLLKAKRILRELKKHNAL